MDYNIEKGTSAWQAAYIMPIPNCDVSEEELKAFTTNTSSGTSGGTFPGTGTTIIWPSTGVQSFQFAPTEPEEIKWELCPGGHVIDAETIKVRDEETYGFCEECACRVSIPRVVGGLSFERAGSAVGRAMSLQEGDGEKVGELMAELGELQRATEAEIVRHKRALGMLDIARGIVEQRAAGNAPVS